MARMIKKAQLGGLIEKGVKAVTKAIPKKSAISKRAAKFGEDYDNLLSDESLDWANSPAMEHYLKNRKPPKNLIKAQQKLDERKAAQLKQIDDSYNTSGPAIRVKRKTGGAVPKAQFGKMIKSGIQRVAGEAKAIKSGIKEGLNNGVNTYKKEKFFNDVARLKGTGKVPKMPKGMGFRSGGKVSKMKNGGKVEKVMREFKEHKLHSGSKNGPIVTNKKQALAIALSEAALSNKKMGWSHKNNLKK